MWTVRGVTGERILSEGQGKVSGHMGAIVKSEPKGAKLKSVLTNFRHSGDDFLEAKRRNSMKVEMPIAKIVAKKEKLSDEEEDEKSEN